MIRKISAAACLACLTLTSGNADAQIIRFGGGVRVRAPFVSVDVLPYGGGTRVRSPFTAVNTGAYRYGYGPTIRVPAPLAYGAVPVYPPAVIAAPPVLAVPPVIAVPPVAPAPPIVVERMPSGLTLAEQLRFSAAQLEQSLSQRHGDGDVWLEYLAPGTIIDVIDQGSDPRTLADLIVHYDGVVGNPQLRSVQMAPGFANTRTILRQFVTLVPPDGPMSPQADAAPLPPEPTPPEPTSPQSASGAAEPNGAATESLPAPEPAPPVAPPAPQEEPAEEEPVEI